MRWTDDRFRNVFLELIEENPLAIRPVLKILGHRFTEEVPTLAVTLTDPPELLINPGFIGKHCKSEAQLKAALFHEFLHVLLGHTIRFKELSEVQNTALDAVINAIIYRQCGPDYSSLFAEYYADQTGIAKLLRPMSGAEQLDLDRRYNRERDRLEREGDLETLAFGSFDVRTQLEIAWDALYKGTLVSDDVLELAETMATDGGKPLSKGKSLIGNHDGVGAPIEGALARAVEEAVRQMSGDGVWRAPDQFGVGAQPSYLNLVDLGKPIERWKSQTLRVLRAALVPDRVCSLVEYTERARSLPILSPRDRRVFLKTLWSPLIPQAQNALYELSRLGSASVYLDVSGSMGDEMPHVLSLLNRLRRYIKMPFWAFSNLVAPARIEAGRLVTTSTGGTSMTCVLEHLAKTKPPPRGRRYRRLHRGRLAFCAAVLLEDAHHGDRYPSCQPVRPPPGEYSLRSVGGAAQ